MKFYSQPKRERVCLKMKIDKTIKLTDWTQPDKWFWCSRIDRSETIGWSQGDMAGSSEHVVFRSGIYHRSHGRYLQVAKPTRVLG